MPTKTIITDYEFQEREADHEEFHFGTDRRIITTKLRVDDLVMGCGEKLRRDEEEY